MRGECLLVSPVQQNLFGGSVTRATRPAPLARTTDPVSSHLAAEAITASGLRASQKRAILEALRSHAEHCTSLELARAAGFDATPSPGVCPILRATAWCSADRCATAASAALRRLLGSRAHEHGSQGKPERTPVHTLLETEGYACTRAAASLGTGDIIGVRQADVVLVQVKTRDWPGRAGMQLSVSARGLAFSVIRYKR